MATSDVEAVRRFNRVVTERVGALSDDYLARSRSLGSSRVLWEIGNGVEDLGTLRARLHLDSGYLSRLLRSLEADGLVEVTSSDEDRRRRVARLTDSGRSEHGVLDTRSDDVASSMLAQLDSAKRRQLVDAMATVERLLTVGLVEVEIEDPASPDARFCIAQYFAELDDRFETGFDPALSISADVDELTEPSGLLVVARLRDQVIGCGALKLHGDRPAEIKRMWVSGDARGLGVGRKLLRALEDRASERGVGVVRLETNRSLSEAISLYRSAGYEEVDAFNDEPFADHWFEKRLG